MDVDDLQGIRMTGKTVEQIAWSMVTEFHLIQEKKPQPTTPAFNTPLEHTSLFKERKIGAMANSISEIGNDFQIKSVNKTVDKNKMATKQSPVKLTIIFLAVALMIVLALGIVTGMFSEHTKSPTNSKSFQDIALSKGYVIQDCTEMFSAYSYIEECLVAAPNEKSFQIEFYVLDNADDTKKFYNSNLSNIIETTGNSISD